MSSFIFFIKKINICIKKLIKKNGFKNFKPDRHSYIDENGQGWLQCKFCCDYKKVDNIKGYITC